MLDSCLSRHESERRLLEARSRLSRPRCLTRPLYTATIGAAVPRRWVVLVAVGVLAVAALAAPGAQARPSGAPGWVTTAKQRLSNLTTKAAGSMTGYQPRVRSFGPAWYDVDLNSCDTRNDILARDLTQVGYKGKSHCKVAKGTLKDPYTGKTIDFVQGKNSSAVQIDHVVALADAWRTGAKKWTPQLRLFYANDPLVLLAVDGPANQAKSDGDAADWLPPNNTFECRYVARQIAIKTKYALWVTPAERKAMTDVLSDC
jgi:hypothetical protein